MKAPILIVLLLAALGACGEDASSRKLSELGDDEYIAECKAVRGDIGMDGEVGLQHYGCVIAARIGGSCNATVFDNCVSAAVSACAAPGATDPVRTCSATVGEARTCLVALGTQYSAFRDVTCALPPSSTPKTAKELAPCASLCAKCPGYPGC